MNNHSNTASSHFLAGSTLDRTVIAKHSIQKNKWFNNNIMLSALAAISTAMISSVSIAAEPIELTYDDWQVVCDNTLTCRLAGYQADLSTNFPASILLTRRAGSNATVTGKIKLGGDKKGANKALMELGNRHRASLFINGKDLGETTSSPTGAGYADLNGTQTASLLEALTKSSKIELVVRNSRWQVSDKGATAAMLKADEAQGRVGTPSAFISTNNAASNNSVFAAKAAPQLRLVIPDQTARSSSNKKFSIRSSQLVKMMQGTMKNIENDCPDFSDETPWEVNRLNGTQILVQHSCWTGAYNRGSGMWVMNDHKPHNPKLVTASATLYDDDGMISSVQKGRGIGDCLTKAEWVWTGKSFAKSYQGSTGLCRLIAAGGAWELPTYVSEVKR